MRIDIPYDITVAGRVLPGGLPVFTDSTAFAEMIEKAIQAERERRAEQIIVRAGEVLTQSEEEE